MAREIGRVVAEHLIEQAQDPVQVGKVIDTWSEHMQKLVGRAVLRMFWWVFLTALLVASIKLGLVDKLHQAFGGEP